MIVHLDDRDKASIMLALRHWQRAGCPLFYANENPGALMSTVSGVPILDPVEVDVLIDRLEQDDLHPELLEDARELWVAMAEWHQGNDRNLTETRPGSILTRWLNWLRGKGSRLPKHIGRISMPVSAMLISFYVTKAYRVVFIP